MSITEAGNVLQAMDRALKRFPEVETVFGKMGRGESPTDAAPINMVETVVALKPRSAWRPGLTWDGLVKEMDAALQFPGMPNVWWMPIQTRTEMLATGIRSPLGIAVHGATLEAIERTALAIERSVGHVAGVRSAFAERNTGGFFIDIVPRRAAAARLGLRVEDINAVVMTAIGGLAVAETVEGRERYPISVRYAREYRDDPAALGRVLVATPAGAQVPLAEVADVRFASGPPMLRSEGGGLVGYVFVDVAERPLVDFVDEAKAVVAKEVALPPGVRLEWVGQYTAYERAKAKLTLVVPITLLLVMLLLWLNTRSLVETAMVMLAVPFSLVGAVWLLWALDYHLSVAVWVGLIALAGLDAETGVVMLLYLTRRAPPVAGIRSPAQRRRPRGRHRRRRRAAHPPQADDRARRHARPAAGAVERRHRRRRHEAHRRADGRRAGDLVPARTGGLPGAVRDVEGALPAAPGDHLGMSPGGSSASSTIGGARCRGPANSMVMVELALDPPGDLEPCTRQVRGNRDRSLEGSSASSTIGGARCRGRANSMVMVELALDPPGDLEPCTRQVRGNRDRSPGGSSANSTLAHPIMPTPSSPRGARRASMSARSSLPRAWPSSSTRASASAALRAWSWRMRSSTVPAAMRR